MKVKQICEAYRSGLEAGWEKEKPANPYPIHLDEHKAFDIGYEDGVSLRIEEDTENRPQLFTASASKGISNHETAFTAREINDALKKALKG